MTLIQVRGTSGSGKSTAVKTVLGMTDWQAQYVSGRRRPLWYRSASEWPATAVIGHYEIPCGGGDTVGSVPQIFEVINALPPDVEHVLCEGLLLSEDVVWTVGHRMPSVCLFLTTPTVECLTRVGARQVERGRMPVDPERVVEKLISRVGRIERVRGRLVSAGVDCRRCSSRQAPRLIMSLLHRADGYREVSSCETQASG